MTADALVPHTPLAATAARLERDRSEERFRCREDGFRVLTEVRCAPGNDADAAHVVGSPLAALNTFVSHRDRLVVSLGPLWWLVDAPQGSMPVEGGGAVSAVEVSAQRTPLVLTGTQARQVLAHGCALDLHADHFAEGSAAQTMLAKAGVLLARTGGDEYRVWVRASFARYLVAWLIDASIEYR